jgi:glutamyl-Q tRNA(Asp) synthetase
MDRNLSRDGADLWFPVEDVAGSAEIQAERFTQPVVSPSDPDTMTQPYRGRFAPSPTGDLHLGSLLAALGSWLLARHARGRWLVRIEDVDPPREIAGATQRQLDALSAFGLLADEPIVRQSQRHELYEAALARLLRDGRAFECHCSRSDLAATGGVHRTCVAQRRRSDPAVRLRVPDGTVVAYEDALQGRQEQDVSREVGDFVLRRTEGFWAYQLAVVVDDAAQAISDVVRGADLLDSTPRQIVLQQALGLPTPRYAHLPLVVDAAGRKLSKSDDALPVDPRAPLPALRAAWLALGQDAAWLAAATDVDSLLARACEAFDPGRIPRVRHIALAAAHNTGFIFAP